MIKNCIAINLYRLLTDSGGIVTSLIICTCVFKISMKLTIKLLPFNECFKKGGRGNFASIFYLHCRVTTPHSCFSHPPYIASDWLEFFGRPHNIGRWNYDDWLIPVHQKQIPCGLSNLFIFYKIVIRST